MYRNSRPLKTFRSPSDKGYVGIVSGRSGIDSNGLRSGTAGLREDGNECSVAAATTAAVWKSFGADKSARANDNYIRLTVTRIALLSRRRIQWAMIFAFKTRRSSRLRLYR